MNELSLHKLAKDFYDERLFIANEKKNLKELQKRASADSEELVHAFWIKTWQHVYLSRSCSNQGFFVFCKSNIWVWDSVQFVNACNYIQSNEESKYSQLFKDLLDDPALVADVLQKGYEKNIVSTPDVALTLMTSCYGNCFITDNNHSVLKFIEEMFLFEVETKTNLNDFRNKESIFHSVFRTFVDMLLDKKPLVLSALKRTIMEIVKNSGVSLETNHQKLITKLTPDEINRMFGNPENESFQKAILEYIGKNVSIIHDLCLLLLSDLRSFFSSLPPMLGQVIAKFHHILQSTGRFSEYEVDMICCDIFLYHFICPSIIDPELHGLVNEIQITEQCHYYNLEQISQVLQNLPYTSAKDEQKLKLLTPLRVLVKSMVDNYSTATNSSRGALRGLKECAVLITASKLDQLVRFLHQLSINHDQLFHVLTNVPQDLHSCLLQSTTSSESSDLVKSSDSIHVSTEVPDSKTSKKNRHISTPSPSPPVREKRNSFNDDAVLVISLPYSEHSAHILPQAEFFKLENQEKEDSKKSEEITNGFMSDENIKTISTIDDDDFCDILSKHANTKKADCEDSALYQVQSIRPRFASLISIGPSSLCNSDSDISDFKLSTEVDTECTSGFDTSSDSNGGRSRGSSLSNHTEEENSKRKSFIFPHIDEEENNSQSLDGNRDAFDKLIDDELEEKSNSKAKQILGDDLSNEEKSDLKAAKTLGIEFIKKESPSTKQKKGTFFKKTSLKTFRSKTVNDIHMNDIEKNKTINKLRNNSSDNPKSDKFKEQGVSEKIPIKRQRGLAFSLSYLKSTDDMFRSKDSTDINLSSTFRTPSISSSKYYSNSNRFSYAPSNTQISLNSLSLPFNSLKSRDDLSSHDHYLSRFDIDFKGYLKKKLEEVFSTFDTPSYSTYCHLTQDSNSSKKDSDSDSSVRLQLLSILNFHLSQCCVSDELTNTVLLRDTIRCVTLMKDVDCRDVIKKLENEHKTNSSYVTYLIRVKQQLLSTLSYLHRVIHYLNTEKALQRYFYTLLCVQAFMKQNESQMAMFENQLLYLTHRSKPVAISDFLSALYGQMIENSLFKGGDSSWLEQVEALIEEITFVRLYDVTMFSNKNEDIQKYFLNHHLMASFSSHITPQHEKLQIPNKYLVNYPWQSAQDELKLLPTYRTPWGKLGAIVRCCKAVICLLEIADRKHPPSADDLLPVLLFVIFKSNPPFLFLTRNYIENYIGDKVKEMESYLWTTFASALSVIEDMINE